LKDKIDCDTPSLEICKGLYYQDRHNYYLILASEYWFRMQQEPLS